MHFIATIGEKAIKTAVVLLSTAIFNAFIASVSFAGSWNGWIYQDPYPTSNNLYAVKFITPMKGWVAGELGTILHTEDSGNTWEAQESGTEEELKSLTFVNDKAGWAVGKNGVIIHTEDGGKTWVSQGDSKAFLDSVFFLNDKEGWAAGMDASGKDGGITGVVLHTRDGGKKWERLDLGLYRNVMSIYFIDPQTGWFLAGDAVHRTKDGGKSWEVGKLPMKLQRPGLAGNGFMPGRMEDRMLANWWKGSLFFADDKKGWSVVGLWFIFHTEDGGKTWADQLSADYMTYGLSRISFRDAQRGCATGSSIICTEDGGKTWRERLGFAPGDSERINDFLIDIWGVSLVDQSAGWAVGNDGQILKSDDGGKTWSMVAKRDECGGNTFFVDKNTGWLHGPYGVKDYFSYNTYICRTDDGGHTWEKQGVGIEVGGLFFIDKSNGWAVGWQKEAEGEQRPGGPYPGKVWNVIKQTTDGGRTWKTQFKGLISNDLFYHGLLGVYFVNRNTGWAVGYKGTILHTKDGGKKWKHQNKKEDSKLNLHKIWFVDSQVGWLIGTKGTEEWTGIILHTKDGGKHWQTQYQLNEAAGLDGIFFLDKKSGWVTGASEYGYGWLLHTANGGETWSKRGFAGIGESSLAFLDKNRGILSTDKGWIVVTTDGGKTWTKMRKPLRTRPWHFSEIFENVQ